jgi:hypothetical protein
MLRGDAAEASLFEAVAVSLQCDFCVVDEAVDHSGSDRRPNGAGRRAPDRTRADPVLLENGILALAWVFAALRRLARIR